MYDSKTMGRDLLYRPPVQQQLPDEEEEDGKKVKKGQGTDAQKRAQLNKDLRARDIGRVGGDELLKKFQQAQKKSGAYKNDYFNKDVNAVRDTNLGTRAARALRGADQAADLRLVGIPGPEGKESPDPAELREAGKRMGLEGEPDLSMGSLLGKHGEWAQGKGVTLEMLKERLAQLEEMVALRAAALGRVGQGRSELEISNVTILQAAIAQGEAMETSEDVAADGEALARTIADEAEGMHSRIRKTLGLKKEK